MVQAGGQSVAAVPFSIRPGPETVPRPLYRCDAVSGQVIDSIRKIEAVSKVSDGRSEPLSPCRVSSPSSSSEGKGRAEVRPSWSAAARAPVWRRSDIAGWPPLSIIRCEAVAWAPLLGFWPRGRGSLLAVFS